MYTQNDPLRRIIDTKGVLIAAHRGTCGGNVIPNTTLSYENALLHGADMIEIDAAMTTDGVFYAFHNGTEPIVFGTDKDIREMTSKEAESYPLINCLGEKTASRVERLEPILERFRGRCLINIDRSWFYWEQILKLLDSMNMKNQLLIKSGVEEKFLSELAESGTDFMYMPILRKPSEWELLEKYPINVAAAELIFTDTDSALVGKDFMDMLREKGIVPWVNAVTLNDEVVLSGHLDDNRAISENFNEAWGRLIRMGFGIIQTDWPALLKGYIEKEHENIIKGGATK